MIFIRVDYWDLPGVLLHSDTAQDLNGAPERIRTSDLCLRRATLYPAELRALLKKQKISRFGNIARQSLPDLAGLS